LDQFRTSFDKSRSVFTGISAGISGISENRISRYLPVFFHKREKKPWFSVVSRPLFLLLLIADLFLADLPLLRPALPASGEVGNPIYEWSFQ
jgi:hypothetical protein